MSIRHSVGTPAGILSNWDLWWLEQKYHVRDYDKFGNTSECRRELWECRQQPWVCWQYGWVHLKAFAFGAEVPTTCPGALTTRLGALTTSLGAAMTSLGMWRTNLGALGTSLEASWITVEQSGRNNIFFGNAAGVPRNYSYYLWFNNFKTHVFSLYSHLCIYTATQLHTVYLEWLQVLRESNSRCACKWQSSELTDTFWDRDQASAEMELEAMIVQTCRPQSIQQ